MKRKLTLVYIFIIIATLGFVLIKDTFKQHPKQNSYLHPKCPKVQKDADDFLFLHPLNRLIIIL